MLGFYIYWSHICFTDFPFSFRSRSSRSSSPPSRSSSSRSAAPPPRPAAPPPPAAHPPAPAPAAHPPAVMQQPSGGGMMAGLGATIAQGFAFGTGSAIAHRAVGAVADSFSGKSDEVQKAPAAAPAPVPKSSSAAEGPCKYDIEAFNRCMQDNKGSASSCDFYYQALQQCQSSNNFWTNRSTWLYLLNYFYLIIYF